MTRTAGVGIALAVLAALRPAAAQESAAAPTRRFAVLVLGTSGFSAEQADGITEVLVAAVVAHGDALGMHFEVVGKEEFQARLGTDERGSLDCVASTECLGRMGVELGVDEVVTGSVGVRPDGGYSLNLTRTDIATAQSRGRAFRRVEGDERALVEEVQAATDQLFPADGVAPEHGPQSAGEPAAPHTHEKLYVRGGVGGGRLHDSFSGWFGFGDGSASGASVALEVVAGGNIAHSLVIGGGVFLESVQKPHVEVDTGSAEDIHVGILGVAAALVVWFPIEGLWLQGGLGAGTLTIKDESGETSTHQPKGVALPLGVGYEWWVSDDWSLGVAGRFLGAALTDDTIKHEVTAVSLLFEVCWD